MSQHFIMRSDTNNAELLENAVTTLSIIARLIEETD